MAVRFHRLGLALLLIQALGWFAYADNQGVFSSEQLHERSEVKFTEKKIAKEFKYSLDESSEEKITIEENLNNDDVKSNEDANEINDLPSDLEVTGNASNNVNDGDATQEDHENTEFKDTEDQTSNDADKDLLNNAQEANGVLNDNSQEKHVGRDVTDDLEFGDKMVKTNVKQTNEDVASQGYLGSEGETAMQGEMQENLPEGSVGEISTENVASGDFYEDSRENIEREQFNSEYNFSDGEKIQNERERESSDISNPRGITDGAQEDSKEIIVEDNLSIPEKQVEFDESDIKVISNENPYVSYTEDNKGGESTTQGVDEDKDFGINNSNNAEGLQSNDEESNENADISAGVTKTHDHFEETDGKFAKESPEVSQDSGITNSNFDGESIIMNKYDDRKFKSENSKNFTGKSLNNVKEKSGEHNFSGEASQSQDVFEETADESATSSHLNSLIKEKQDNDNSIESAEQDVYNEEKSSNKVFSKIQSKSEELNRNLEDTLSDGDLYAATSNEGKEAKDEESSHEEFNSYNRQSDFTNNDGGHRTRNRVLVPVKVDDPIHDSVYEDDLINDGVQSKKYVEYVEVESEAIPNDDNDFIKILNTDLKSSVNYNTNLTVFNSEELNSMYHLPSLRIHFKNERYATGKQILRRPQKKTMISTTGVNGDEVTLNSLEEIDRSDVSQYMDSVGTDGAHEMTKKESINGKSWSNEVEETFVDNLDSVPSEGVRVRTLNQWDPEDDADYWMTVEDAPEDEDLNLDVFNKEMLTNENQEVPNETTREPRATPPSPCPPCWAWAYGWTLPSHCQFCTPDWSMLNSWCHYCRWDPTSWICKWLAWCY